MVSAPCASRKNSTPDVGLFYGELKEEMSTGNLPPWLPSRKDNWDFPGSSVVGNPPASAGDTGLGPGS